MPIAFFNTLTRKKEPFEPITPGLVKMYTCGPTVYDHAHIGNFRTYVFEDVLRRWLKASGYAVTQVMNITDVDDKTIAGAHGKKVSLSEYTHDYINSFFEDLVCLRIEMAEYYPRATEHIPDMVTIIKDLLAKGIAYKSEDGSLYYNVAKFPGYGELAHIEVGELKAGARVSHDEYDKEQASDFALWKAWTPDDGNVFWETELGKGRPGWHIECSAMSMKYLGPHFDIHTGGVDNIFPHHQNEIAQSEAFSGKPFVNHWLHSEHLIVEGRKMSKSLGNFYTVRSLLAKNYSPMALRYVYVTSHYRSKLNFTLAGLAGAQSTLDRIEDWISKLKRLNGPGYPALQAWTAKAKSDFDEAMNDDLNTPRAMGVLHEFMNDLTQPLESRELSADEAETVKSFFAYADRIFGLGFEDFMNEQEVTAEIRELIERRETARKTKDFKKSDEIRKMLKEKGIVIEDTPWGPRWKVSR